MVEFAYNNTKNAGTSHIPFELNYGDHPRMSYKKDVNLCSQSKSVDKLSAKVRELMIVCQKNLYYA